MFKAVLHGTASSLMSGRAQQFLVPQSAVVLLQKSLSRRPLLGVPSTAEALSLQGRDGHLPSVCPRPVCSVLETPRCQQLV